MRKNKDFVETSHSSFQTRSAQSIEGLFPAQGLKSQESKQGAFHLFIQEIRRDLEVVFPLQCDVIGFLSETN